MTRFTTVAALTLTLLSVSQGALTVRVFNATGDISARVKRVSRVEIRTVSPTRPIRPQDRTITQGKDLLTIECHPDDGAKIHLELEIPYGVGLEARTEAGTISLTGMVPYADLRTSSGTVLLTAPWEATRFTIQSENEPREISLPKGLKVSRWKGELGRYKTVWQLSDKLPKEKVTYGEIRIHAVSPRRISLEDMAVPEDSPVKLPWQAPAVIEDLLAGKLRINKPKAQTPAHTESTTTHGGQGAPVFRSEVRMVNLQVAVFDAQGRPVTGLTPEDFELLEDGVRQKVAFAGSEEVPFNLVLLLDLSGSTKKDRPAMKEAARQFIRVSRPQDRVAIYALAYELFQVIAPLGTDRNALLASVDAIPDVGGGTPLYDIIVLSYAQELMHRPDERNALVVISDGLDNQIQGEVCPSKVPLHKLRQAAALMNVIIYPIYLSPFTLVPPPPWAVKAQSNLSLLAETTGGRVFQARSIRDLEPVYAMVAEELRSVYSMAYYPSNQNFDGSWRQIKVRVLSPGIRVRTRQGYFAR
jgi:VWFA-related protein